jgi:hypothetical protein
MPQWKIVNGKLVQVPTAAENLQHAGRIEAGNNQQWGIPNPPTVGLNPVEGRTELGGAVPAAPAQPAVPFNPGYAQTMREVAARRLGIDSLQELGTRRINEDYTSALDTLGRGRDQTLNRLKTGLADRGILYSGANIKKQGEIQEDYSRSKGSVDQTKTRSLEDLIRDITNQRTELQNIEERAAIEKSREDIQTQLQQA